MPRTEHVSMLYGCMAVLYWFAEHERRKPRPNTFMSSSTVHFRIRNRKFNEICAAGRPHARDIIGIWGYRDCGWIAVLIAIESTRLRAAPSHHSVQCSPLARRAAEELFLLRDLRAYVRGFSFGRCRQRSQQSTSLLSARCLACHAARQGRPTFKKILKYDKTHVRAL